MFRSWWQRLVGGKFPPLTQSARKSRDRVRPGLEQLEDRCVPATFTVTNLNDSGAGSLREAIAFANDETNNPGADTIVFQSGLSGQLNLSTAGNTTYGPSAFLITSTISIDGFSGGGNVVLARSVAATNLRLFRIDVGANLSLDGLTVKGFKLTGFNGSDGGYGGGGGGGAGLGGAILNQGTLTITRCLFQNNEAIGGKGGGVPDVTSGGGGGGGLSGAGGTVSGSTGGAGGLDGGGAGGNFGGGNGANGGFGGGGGGGAASLGQAGNGGMGGFGGGGGGAGVNGDVAQNGTFGLGGYGGGQGGAVQSNTGGVGGGGAGMGGGIFNWGGTLTITNSTFHNNKAQGGAKGTLFGGSGGAANGAGFGGAVFSRNGTVKSVNNTFSNNIADQGGGVYVVGDGAAVNSTVYNTILANSSGSAKDYYQDAINSGSLLFYAGYNVIEQHQVGLNGVVSTADPGLGALQNNGGPTSTMAITSSSPAYNQGDAETVGDFSLTTDQRGTGFARSVGSPDIGAFELAPSLPPAPSAPDLSAASDSGPSTTDNITNDNTPTFTGTAQANSTVKLFSGGTQVGSTTANGSGNWTITASSLSDGSHSITATATNADGTGPASSALSITVDTQTPATPSITSFSQDSGTAGDNITNDNTITLNGTAEPNSTITVFDGATQLGTATANGSGSWTYTTGTLTNAVHSFTAKASDTAGNQSGSSSTLAVTVDTSVTASNLSFADDSGAVGDGITNDATVTLSGTADPFSSVRVIVDYTIDLETTTADAQGNWSVQATLTPDYTNVYYAIVTDVAGNTTTTAQLTIVLDTTAPSAPTLTGFSDDSGVSGDAVTNDTTLTLSGSAEGLSTVTIFDGSTELGTTTANEMGVWTFTTTTLSDSAHSFTATASDAAGNESAASTALVVTVDTQAPNAPSITGYSQDSGTQGDNRTNDATITLSGTAGPNTTVTVFDGASELGTTTADGSGNWTYTTSSLSDAAHSFTAKSSDAAGNQSSASTALSVTVDTQAPNAPSVTGYSQDSGTTGDNRTNDNTVTLSGTAEPNSTVTVFDGATQLGTTTADGSGDWSYTTSALSDDAHSFTATATDAAGNTSSASTALSVTIDTQTPGVPSITGFSQDSGTNGDNRTNDDTVTLSGTAEPNSIVTVFDGATELGTATANGSGNWSYTTSSRGDGAHSFTATAADAAGNQSAASSALVVTVDTQAPNAPSITGFSQDSGATGDGRTNDSTITLSGTAEPNSTVTVFDGATELGTATADSSGAWSYTTGTLGEGAHSFTATATDAAGNTSVASSALAVTVDTQAPNAPSITGYSQDSGATGDNTTNDNTVTLSGTTEANSTVVVFDGATQLGTATVDGSGNWSYTTGTLSDGAHSFTAVATDAAGNQGVASTALTVTVDTSAPATPGAPEVADDDAPINDGLTADDTLSLSGMAEVGATVTIFDGATQLGTVVATDGTWQFTTASLADGQHSFTVTATDVAGNASSGSTAVVVEVDTTPPAVPTITGYSEDTGTEDDGITRANTLTLTGTADPNTTVTVLDGTTALGTAAVDAQGAWSYTTPTLGDATHSFTATAFDAAYNTSAASASLSITIDTLAPSAPAITAYQVDSGVSGDGVTNANPLALSGTAEPHSTIAVLDGVNVLGSTTTNAQGAWTFTTPELSDGAHSFTVTATDAAGNSSIASAALSVTVDTQAPGVPSVTGFSQDSGTTGDRLTNDATLTLSGSAEPNSTVTVFDGATELGTTTADGQGAWSYTTSTLGEGTHSFTASAADAAGNQGSASSAFVVSIDTDAPNAPSITGYSQDSGTSGDNLTNDSTITLSGTAEPNSTVTVFDGTTRLGTATANAQGNWTYTTAALSEGLHDFTATATDAADNTSVASSSLSVTTDTQAPIAPAITGFSQDSGTLGDNITSDTTVTLTGTAEPNSLVTLFDGTTLLGSNQADAQGAWSMTTAVLSEGVHSFTATATDAAGNTSDASTALSVTVDSQAPNAPAVTGFSQDSGATGDNLTNDNTLTLSGTAEPDSTVTIFDGVNQLGTATADAQGGWTFTTGSLSDGAHSFSATARDAAGNLSVASASFAVTIDTQTPDAPGITSYSQDTGAADGLTSDTTLTLVGSAEPLSTVAVFDGATQLGTTTANAQGVWSYTTAVLLDGAHSLAARATDAAGNQSASSAVLAVQVDTVAPVVQSIESVGPSTVVSSTMQFTVTFNRPVTGVNLGDFQATTTGTLSGVTPTNLQGAGAVYTVTVSVGSGSGTVRLDVTDDDSIRAVNDLPLGGAFTAGEVVSRRKAPTLTALDAPKGSGVVQVFNPDGSPRFNLTPYAGHTKGVDAAVGDVNGDGFSDVVTGVSRGGPPTVKVFDGLTGEELRTIVAFKATFTGGVSVAAGDVNGDGRADIIVGAGLGHGPKVNVYSGLDGSLIKSFLAYGADFTGGVRVAAGDVNGDGRADVVTSQLSGAAMMVKVFSGLNFTLLDKIQPFGPFELSKTALAVGDFNNDGRADIAVIGGTQPLLRIYNGDSLVERASLKAFSALDGGLWLTAGDVNGDDVVDLIAVTGSNLEMRVKHFNGLTLAQLDNFFATFPAV